MNEKTEQRLTGWGSIALGVIALVITGLASIVRGLTANIPVPLWVFLVAVLLGFVLVFKNGAYFRTGDTDLTQPFCRVCLDSRGELITVSEEAPWDSDFNGFLPIYYCPACKRGHPRQVVEPKPVDDDEENLL
jgi:hypothetical protein